jgi:hypothetical protein
MQPAALHYGSSVQPQPLHRSGRGGGGSPLAHLLAGAAVGLYTLNPPVP